MKTNKFYNIFLAVFIALLGVGCSDSDNITPEFSLAVDGAEISTIEFGYNKGRKIIKLDSNVRWTAQSDQSWCTLSNTGGEALKSEQDYYLIIRVEANDGTSTREASVEFNVGGEQHLLTVVQKAYDPDSRPAGMKSTAMQLMRKVEMGWNIGNTLEAPDGETSWGNPEITRDLIKKYKELGISSLRLPCAWNSHADENGTIDPTWMARVKQVVDWIVEEDMYVMLNIHWDGGWMERHVGIDGMTEEDITAVDNKLRNYWTQIATTFRNYDEHVFFAGANEPEVKNTDMMDVLARYEQTFVDAVRATGGNNQYRVLVIQGPNTDIERTLSWMYFPTDPTPESMVLEVHFYSPWHFVCNLEDEYQNDPLSQPYIQWVWGKDYIQYGNYETYYQEEQVITAFSTLQERFVDFGIPVLIGEFAGDARYFPDKEWTKEEFYQRFLESRNYYHGFITEQMKLHGITPYFWETGGMINRTAPYDFKDEVSKTAFEAIIKAALDSNYPN